MTADTLPMFRQDGRPYTPPKRAPRLPYDRTRLPCRGRSMLTVVVACGASKLSTPAPARALYIGALFTSARVAAERLTAAWTGGPARWWVASAKHGLVHPDEVLRPYNLALTSLPRDRQDTWARVTHSELVYRPDTPEPGQAWAGLVDPDDHQANSIGSWDGYGGSGLVVSFAPAAYTAAVQHAEAGPSIPPDWPVARPLAGLGLGEQRGRLRRIANDPDAFLDDPLGAGG